jgi:hypothetical protein
MYMKPPKLRSTSMDEFTSSWRASVSPRYLSFQFRAAPAQKQARRSSRPRQPVTPMTKRPMAVGRRRSDSVSIHFLEMEY